MGEDAHFSVKVASITGTTFVLDMMHPGDVLQKLRSRIAEHLKVSRGIVSLVLDSKSLQPAQYQHTLGDIGIGEGTVITYVKQRVFEVSEGLRIEVTGAGTDRVNGMYICRKVYRG